MFDGWKSYVSAAERRGKAVREIEKYRKQGHSLSPVILEDRRAIVKTFWGKAWCENLERYSDFASRLPRGRTYLRNGSVIDLQIARGTIHALVSGSQVYRVGVQISPVTKARWDSICTDCAAAIDSLVELLQGRFSKGVMERICRQNTGLFPSPKDIKLSCSCPDWAEMCKHVAAVLYGIGARFDQQPELLFRLHQVDEKELIAQVGQALPLTEKEPVASRLLGSADLVGIFGLDMAQDSHTESSSSSEVESKKSATAPVGKKAIDRSVDNDKPRKPHTLSKRQKTEAGSRAHGGR